MKVKVNSIAIDDETNPESVIVGASGECGNEESPDPAILELVMTMPINRATEFYIGQELEVQFKK